MCELKFCSASPPCLPQRITLLPGLSSPLQLAVLELLQYVALVLNHRPRAELEALTAARSQDECTLAEARCENAGRVFANPSRKL